MHMVYNFLNLKQHFLTKRPSFQALNFIFLPAAKWMGGQYWIKFSPQKHRSSNLRLANRNPILWHWDHAVLHFPRNQNTFWREEWKRTIWLICSTIYEAETPSLEPGKDWRKSAVSIVLVSSSVTFSALSIKKKLKDNRYFSNWRLVWDFIAVSLSLKITQKSNELQREETRNAYHSR